MQTDTLNECIQTCLMQKLEYKIKTSGLCVVFAVNLFIFVITYRPLSFVADTI